MLNNNNQQNKTCLFGEFSSFKWEFHTQEESMSFLEQFNMLRQEDWFDECFLYNWYPDYFHADLIAWNDDLYCYAANEWKSLDFGEERQTPEEWANDMEIEYGIKGNTKEEKLRNAAEIVDRFDNELYAEALYNYISTNHEWPAKTYKLPS